MNNAQNIITSILQIMQTGNNPDVLLNSLAQKNPQVRALLNQKRQNNMSYQDLVVQLAKQNNINLTPILQGLNNNGIKM